MHNAETGASRRFPRVLKNSRVLIELNNALRSFFISLRTLFWKWFWRKNKRHKQQFWRQCWNRRNMLFASRDVRRLRPRAVLKTSGKVFPNTDQLRLVNSIFFSLGSDRRLCQKYCPARKTRDFFLWKMTAKVETYSATHESVTVALGQR